MQTLHATCVAFEGRGILLRGPSGSGKSDLALRLIERGGKLVADDVVSLHAEDGKVIAGLPSQAEQCRGMLEVRGIGLITVPHLPGTPLDLVIDLGAAVDRLPDYRSVDIAGLPVRAIALNPFETSAVAKIVALLTFESAA